MKIILLIIRRTLAQAYFYSTKLKRKRQISGFLNIHIHTYTHKMVGLIVKKEAGKQQKIKIYPKRQFTRNSFTRVA